MYMRRRNAEFTLLLLRTNRDYRDIGAKTAKVMLRGCLLPHERLDKGGERKSAFKCKYITRNQW